MKGILSKTEAILAKMDSVLAKMENISAKMEAILDILGKIHYNLYFHVLFLIDRKRSRKRV